MASARVVERSLGEAAADLIVEALDPAHVEVGLEIEVRRLQIPASAMMSSIDQQGAYPQETARLRPDRAPR